MTMPFRLSTVALLISVGALGSAVAETTTDRYGKELKIEPSRNIFARFGVLGIKLNNKSEAARDVTGPVLSRPANLTAITPGDRGWMCYQALDSNGDPLPRCDPSIVPYIGPGGAISTVYADSAPGGVLDLLYRGTGVDELGLPENVKANFKSPAPGAIGTLGMYLDEDHKWAVEVPVMALPFDIDVDGAGAFQNAGKIIKAKALGLLVFGHYYFGQKNDKFRPSVSLTANYLIPFNVRATSELERWTGGRTKVSTKSSFGLGWMIGGKYAFDDRWDFNLNVGQFKAKVDSTLITYDTILTENSPIFTYWPGQLGANLRALKSNSGILANQLNSLRAYRNYNPANRVNGGANLGTFTRTQSQTLDPYVVMMSVGYNF